MRRKFVESSNWKRYAFVIKSRLKRTALLWRFDLWFAFSLFVSHTVYISLFGLYLPEHWLSSLLFQIETSAIGLSYYSHGVITFRTSYQCLRPPSRVISVSLSLYTHRWYPLRWKDPQKGSYQGQDKCPKTVCRSTPNPLLCSCKSVRPPANSRAYIGASVYWILWHWYPTC